MSWTAKKIAKFFGWFFLSVTLLIVAALIFLRIIAYDYIKRNLFEQVKEKSGGLYEIFYEDVRIKLIPLSVYIQDIELRPNELVAQKISKESPDKIIYSFESPEIRISGIDIKKLVKTKTFHCRNFMIRAPILKLSGEDIVSNKSSQTFDYVARESHPLFRKYIKKIVIDKIEFEDAHYGLSRTIADTTQFSKAEQISVDILNFRTDSAMVFSGNRIVETDDIIIRMNNFRNNMGDSIHVLHIDTLKYSLQRSDIRATNFYLGTKQKDSTKNIYDVFVPKLFVKSKSITHLAFHDSVKIQFLEFENPTIRFYHKQNPQRLNAEDLNSFDLYPLIKKDFIKIEIDSFYLVNANMEIYRQPDTTEYQQKFESVNIVLDNFGIDSLSAQNVDKLFHADDFEMLVSGYQLRLEDNQHDFKADSIIVSTFKNFIRLINITVNPADSATIDSRTVVNIKSTSLEIEDVDLKKLYFTRTLPTSKIEIKKPNVLLQYHREKRKTGKQKEAGLLFEIVSAYLKGVYSNLVFIENGKLNIENLYNNKLQGYFETNFNFSLTDFALDSASLERTDKFFYATNFDLRFGDYQMKLADDLHKLDVDSVFISSINQQIKISNLHLQPTVQNISTEVMQRYNRSELYKIFVPEINVQQIDLRNAFFYNKLGIQDFQIYRPKIYFENFGALRSSKETMEFEELYQLIFSYIYDFDIENISISEGNLTWVNHTRKGRTISFDNDFSANLTNFKLNENELNKQRLLFSDNFNISVKDQIFQLSDSVHILRAGEIRLSTADSKIDIKNALLYPVITSKQYNRLSTTWQVAIPDLELTDFDFLKAYYSRELKLDKLNINNPKVQVYSKPGPFKSLDLKKYSFPLPSLIESLKLDEFRINNAEVITYENEGSNHKAVSIFKMNISMPDLTLSNNETNRAQLNSSNFTLNIFAFKSPLGKTHNISVDNLNFNRAAKSVAVQQFKIFPFLPNNQGNKFNITVPEIHFNDFDIYKAIEDNDFLFDNIDIQNPSVEIEINDSIQGDKLDFLQTLDLYPFTEPFVDRIQINSLDLESADINFNWFKKDVINRKINFVFKNILIAENQPPANILNSNEFEITTEKLRDTDKSGFYEFTADSFMYNSSQHSILFKTVAINPLLTKEEINRVKKFQTDVVKANIDYIKLDGINEKQWLTENILVSELLTIGKSDVSIYRNKRYPFNPNQRPSWPQDLIKKIKQPFIIDSIILKPSYLNYSELLGISDTPGFVDFHHLHFNTGKISNMDEITSQINNFKIDASALLYNQATLSATISLDLSDNNYTHTVNGSLGKMQIPIFNAMLEKSAPLSLESGNINRFDFNIALDKNQALGELYFAYDDLKISLLDYGDDEVKRAKFASFWANKMLLNSENPKGKEFLPETISYERDKQRSIINYWWKSIFTSAKKVIGLEEDK